MKQAIIVHGKPSKQSYFNPNLPSTSNSIWIPWLQQQLLICGIDTQTPEMPESWRPDYSLWRQTFEKYDVIQKPYWLVIVVAGFSNSMDE